MRPASALRSHHARVLINQPTNTLLLTMPLIDLAMVGVRIGSVLIHVAEIIIFEIIIVTQIRRILLCHLLLILL